MQILRLTLGGPDIDFIDAGRISFEFPSEVNGAFAILQGFSLHKEDSDLSLNSVQVSLEVFMDALQPRKAGVVQAALILTGPSGLLSLDTGLIRAEIRMLVFGI